MFGATYYFHITKKRQHYCVQFMLQTDVQYVECAVLRNVRTFYVFDILSVSSLFYFYNCRVPIILDCTNVSTKQALNDTFVLKHQYVVQFQDRYVVHVSQATPCCVSPYTSCQEALCDKLMQANARCVTKQNACRASSHRLNSTFRIEKHLEATTSAEFPFHLHASRWSLHTRASIHVQHTISVTKDGFERSGARPPLLQDN